MSGRGRVGRTPCLVHFLRVIVALNDLLTKNASARLDGALHLRDETVVLVPVIAVVGQDEVRRGKINHESKPSFLVVLICYYGRAVIGSLHSTFGIQPCAPA